jgi:hypothetical protein
MALALSVSAHAGNVELTVDPGFFGGSAHDFTFDSNWSNFGSSPYAFMTFTGGVTDTITYEKGSFTFNGFSLNARPWDGYNENLPDQSPGYLLNYSLKDINGIVITTGQVNLLSGNAFQTVSASVSGVHSIEFSSDNSNTASFFPRLKSIDYVAAVPEPETYAMLLLGLAAVGAAARRRKRA